MPRMWLTEPRFQSAVKVLDCCPGTHAARFLPQGSRDIRAVFQWGLRHRHSIPKKKIAQRTTPPLPCFPRRPDQASTQTRWYRSARALEWPIPGILKAPP